MGPEATGLDAAALGRSTPIRVPMREGVESLNVVAAAAVLLFEGRRQCDLRDQRGDRSGS
jgi:tRNA G18 (ribose-2'-O)-methylase SpoU